MLEGTGIRIHVNILEMEIENFGHCAILTSPNEIVKFLSRSRAADKFRFCSITLNGLHTRKNKKVPTNSSIMITENSLVHVNVPFDQSKRHDLVPIYLLTSSHVFTSYRSLSLKEFLIILMFSLNKCN